MKRRARVLAISASTIVAVGGAATGVGLASTPHGRFLTGVPTANSKSDGYSPPSKLSPQLRQVVVAQGSTKVENPGALVSYYGYFNDVTNAAGAPQMLPTPTTNTEAQKSEPDKNTYLVFNHSLAGADPRYSYGTHFLFQGHEGGVDGKSWLAEGRDPSATIDSAFGGFGKNEGDNEITGAHVSNGDPGARGILGAQAPNLRDPGWRWFYTQQHGDNSTWEVLYG